MGVKLEDNCIQSFPLWRLSWDILSEVLVLRCRRSTCCQHAAVPFLSFPSAGMSM